MNEELQAAANAAMDDLEAAIKYETACLIAYQTANAMEAEAAIANYRALTLGEQQSIKERRELARLFSIAMLRYRRWAEANEAAKQALAKWQAFMGALAVEDDEGDE